MNCANDVEQHVRTFKGGVLFGALLTMLGMFFIVLAVTMLDGDWWIFVLGAVFGMGLMIVGLIVWDAVEGRKWKRANVGSCHGTDT